MGKYEAKPNKKSKADKPKAKKRSRVGLIVSLTVVTLVAVGAIWFLSPPVVPAYPDTDPTTPTNVPTDSDGNTIPTQPVQTDKNAKIQKENVYTFLVLGTNDNYNTDVIMLATLDLTDAKKPVIDVVSIPRDSMVDYDSPIKRINGVMGYYGFKKDDAVDEMKKRVEQVTGVYPNYYCIVDLKAFLKIVDVVGGVDFYVPQRMYHPDKDASQTIDLQKGQQTLSSKKALQLVRYRSYPGGDLERINTQKDFLIAMLKTVLNKFSIGMIPDLLDTVFDSIRTDMTLQNMLWFATNGIYPIDMENDLRFHTLPISHTGKYASGDYGNQDYIYLDENAIPEFINSTVNPYTRDITKKDLHIIILENKK